MGCIVRTNYQLKFRMALKKDRKDTVSLEYLSSSNTYIPDFFSDKKSTVFKFKPPHNSDKRCNQFNCYRNKMARTDGAKILSISIKMN